MEQQEKIEQIAHHIKEIIKLLGEDPEREGLLKTPMRSAKALCNITAGYNLNPNDTIRQAIFEYSGSRMVIVKDIEFYSMCEHHILPFFGKISIGYIPKGQMVGLSKLARLVDVFAKRLQVQERLTSQIAEAVQSTLDTSGAIVLCTAQHLCMKMRGVEKQESSTTTIDYTGQFAENPYLREEFLRQLK